MNKFTTILEPSKNMVGPGHNANFVTDDEGSWWMLYHGFEAFNPEDGRKVYLDHVLWDSGGWPYIEGGSPSVEAEVPVFRKQRP